MSTLQPYSTFIPPLPPGWTEHQAPGGQIYYHNASTNQSTYTRPLPGIPGSVPFMAPGAVIPGFAVSKEKKKKERPLNKTPVPGTPWLRVKTTEGNVFWTHKERKESVWEVPEEIKELAEEMEREEKEKEAKDIEAMAQQELEEREKEAEGIKRKEREEVERVMEEVKDAVAAGKRKAAEPLEADNSEHKKPRVEKEPDEEHWQRQIAEEMMAEVGAQTGHDSFTQEVSDPEHSSPSAEQDTRQNSAAPIDTNNNSQPSFKVPDRVDLSIEEAKALFKTLLQEKNINPLHPWDKSLPLFISDPRYVLLPSVSARREAFDDYCRDSARAQRSAKAASIKEEFERASVTERDRDKEAYLTLLKGEVTSTRTTWHEFRRKWKKDRRFFGWAGERERERAFRDWLRDLADVKKKQADKAEREFFQLLREQKEIKPGDHWKEAKRKINSKDPRYDAVGSSSLREELFATYIKTISQSPTQAAKPDSSQTETQEQDDDATRRKQRAERAERGLREREEKVRRERAGLERELGRTRGVVEREEGEREFMMLLTDAVRDPQANWDTSSPSLYKDPRFVLCALPLSVQKGLFSKHVARLREKHLAGLHSLFVAHASRLNTRWHDLDESTRHTIRGSVAVGKLGLSDNDLDPDLDDRAVQHDTNDALEAEFERWQRTRINDARNAFDAMLNENSFLEFWGRMGKASGDDVGADAPAPDEDDEEGEGGGGRADLKKLAQAIDKGEIEKVLKNDSRWMVFDHMPEQRERWLRDYMEKLAAPKLSVHIPDRT